MLRQSKGGNLREATGGECYFPISSACSLSTAPVCVHLKVKGTQLSGKRCYLFKLGVDLALECSINTAVCLKLIF